MKKKLSLLLALLLIAITGAWADTAVLSTPSESVATLSDANGIVTIADGSGNTGIQQGSGSYKITYGETAYVPMKLSGSRNFTLSYKEGVTISKVTLLAMSNGDAEGTVGAGDGDATSLGTFPARNADGNCLTVDITGKTGLRGSRQFLALIVVEYSTTAPSLKATPDALTFALNPNLTTKTQTFMLTGQNLTNGEYALEVPNLAGLTVEPASFTVADGKVNQEISVTYASTEDVAKATADITAKVGDLTASVAVTYQSRATAYTQSTISEAATWDWSKLSETVELTDASNPTKTEEFLLADLDDRINFVDAFGDAKAIKMEGMQFPTRGGYAQGNIIKLKTSVAGTIDVDFSNTGKDRPYRYLYVNGEPTEFKSNEATKLSATGIEVPAGDIELKGYIPDATDPVSRDGDVVGDAMLRWYKITFTPKAEGGEEPSGETTYPITATWDFQNLNPAALADVNIQGNNEADVASDVDGISMHVISAGGKLQYNASGYAQFNTNTTIQVPVGSTKDIVTVVSYPGQSKYTVGDEDATGQNTFSHTATVAEVTQGYVEITPTATSYIYSIKVVMNEPEESDEPAAGEDVTAQWDFQNLNPAALADVNIQGNNEADVASDVDGISMHVISAGGKLQYNASGYAQFNTNTTIQVPVKNKGDEVTVVSYPGQSNYTVGGEDAAGQNTFTHTATSAEAATGYVEIIPTKTAYIYSIKVVHKAQTTGPVLVEKSIYKTDFSDWTKADPSDPATTVTKTTKYTKQDLVFTLFQTSVMATEDTKFSAYTTLPRMTVRAEKEKGSYFTTSALAEITKIRFIHGATGSNRGWKVEAKGDGDADWVVVSSDAANPQNWCEVTKSINKKNCQLRFTNLADKQNAFLFELEIFGNVDLAGEPLLGSFKANGEAYAAEDIFEMNSAGNYEGTIEVSKSAEMISEKNPLSDIATDNGKYGDITYVTSGEGADEKTIVTIPVTAEKGTVNYILTVVRKPDFTLTYYDLEGKEIGTQKVEKDAKIGKFEVNIDEVKAATEGYKARGWFKNNYVGEKYSVDDVITGDTKLYSVETEIEVSSDSRKYEFDLRSKTFYAEDHEAFNVISEKAKWHDGTHGWSFYNGDKIELLVGKKATISVALCQYGSGTNILVKNAAGETLETLAAKSETDGALVSYNYEGVAGTLTLEMEAGGEMYIHSVKIFNTTTTNYDQKGQWIYVKQGDASSFLDAIDAANGMSGTERVFIYVPNGTYDLRQKTLTTIGRNNISIIGESMEGTIIKNRPVKEGIAITATLLNTATNTYLQDLTLDCIAPYGTGDDTKSAERGVCFQDKGTKTVMKNVYLKGLQDTYYSNGAEGMTGYFETCKIEGTVDFICGSGSILFNECDLYVADRSQSKTSANVITAPATYASEKGYAFYGCTIDGTDNQKDKYNLGRPWQKSPAATYVNTTMKINASAAGWTSMNKADAIRFHEFNTKNAEGTEIKSHNVNACETTGTKDELYLTAEQAVNYAPDKFFTSWAPATAAAQFDAPTDATLKDGTITWTAVEGAAGYAIFANDELLGIVETTSYTITEAAGARRADGEVVYTIRTVNAMGGFGEARTVTDATAISKVKADEKIDWNNQVVYDLQGRRVKNASKGVFIINGHKVIIK